MHSIDISMPGHQNISANVPNLDFTDQLHMPDLHTMPSHQSVTSATKGKTSFELSPL